MSTTQFFQTAGAIIGSYFGPWGSAIGSAIGTAIGGALEDDIVSHGPRLDDRRVQISTYGASIPYLFGTTRIAGNVIWSEDIEEITTETEAGKGGPSQVQITYSYFGTFAVLLGVGPLRGIRRIWADAVLVFDGTVTPALGDVSYAFYSGSEDQLPDPTIEADLGVGNTPAYRGSGYIVFNRLPLEKFGNRLPSITVECTASGDFSSTGTALGTAPVLVPGFAGIDWGKWFMGGVQRSDGQVVTMVYPNATGPGTSAGLTLTVLDQFTGEPLLSVAHPTVTGSNEVVDWNLMCYVPAINEVWVSAVGSQIFRFNAATLVQVGIITLAGGVARITWEPHTRRVFFRPNASWVSAGGRNVVLGAGIFNIDVLRLINTTPNVGFSGGDSAFVPPDPDDGKLTDAGTIDLDAYINSETVDAVITALPTVFLTDGSAQSAQACFDATRNRYVVIMGRIWTVTDEDPPVIAVRDYPVGATVYSLGSVTFDSGTDSIIIVSGVVGLNTVTILDAGTFALLRQSSVSGDGSLGTSFAFQSTAGSLLMLGTYQPWQLEYFSTTVGAAVQRLGIEAGLIAGDMNVTELSMRLRGFVVSQPGPSRSAVEMLARDFLFHGVEEDDKMVFRRRGGAIVATIPEADCGASVGGGTPDPIATTRAQEVDLPARLSVTAPDPALDYQPDTQQSKRRAVEAGQEEGITSAVVMSATENKRLADALIFDRWASRESIRWSTSRRYARLSATDPIVLAGRRVRIATRSDEGGAIRWEGYTDDADVVAQTSTGVQGAFPGQSPSIQVPTVMVVLDTALLADAQDHAGAYVAAYGVAPFWRGAVIYDSADGGTGWTRLATVPRPGSEMGFTTDALADWTGGNVFDEVSSVNVAITNGTLASTTRAGVLAGNNPIAINGTDGWEVLQYRTATLEVDGTYTLTGLLRGRRGTGFATGGHAIGDRAVPLSSSNLRDLAIGNTQVGVSTPFKAVSVGDTLSITESRDITIMSERQKPWSPVDFRALRDVSTGDITMTWKRRTRLACRFTGAVGINVPLGEASEAYVVRILDPGSPNTIVRTITVTGPATAAYTAAQQTSDFGGLQSTVYVRITQTSAAVGAGHPLEAAA